MSNVKIQQNQIVVGSKKIPLVSGEVHYWRLNPTYWKTILDQVKAMGIEVISTYVPWDYHEHKRGHFDFHGKTDETRNLVDFLKLTRRLGFWVIIRPGPYIYSEWPNDGIPSYAYKFHRLHPKFLGFAGNYLKKVLAVIRPFLASRRNGHIIMVQADNEIDPWPDVFGHQYGLSGKPGLFQEFLKRRYGGDVHLLNERWGTQYRNFNEPGPYIACMMKDERGLPLKGDRELKRNLDYFEFKYDYAHACAKWNVSTFRKLGIDVPIYLNLYPFFYAHDWARMQSECDLVGIDLYPSNELMEDEHEQRKLIDKVRYLRSCSKVPYIAEFAAGVWHARHYESGVLMPNHYRLITLSAMIGGATGWNWYMLVNRDNWYMSPINEWGRPRAELYHVFHDLVKLFHRVKPQCLEKLTEIGVTFNPIQYAARTMPVESQILMALYEGDVDYELVNPELGVPPAKPVLFYSGNQWLSKRAQMNLRTYVERGGTLVAFRNFPRKDENFESCNLLGFEEPSRVLFEFKRKFELKLDKERHVELNSSVYGFDSCEGSPIKVHLGNYGFHTVGYRKKVGKGLIVHLGVEPNRELVLAILEHLKIPSYSMTSTRDVKTAFFRNNGKFYLIATNNGCEDKSANIQLIIPNFRPKRLVTTDLQTHETKEILCHKGAFVHLDIPKKDGKVLEISAK